MSSKPNIDEESENPLEIKLAKNNKSLCLAEKCSAPLSTFSSVPSALTFHPSPSIPSKTQNQSSTESDYDENRIKFLGKLLTRSKGTIYMGRRSTMEIDCFGFAQISPYFRAAFYSYFEESKTKVLFLDKTKGKRLLHCCLILEQIMNGDEIAPDLMSMNLKEAVEVLDIASYFLLDPLLEFISNIIVEIVTADSIVITYHKAEYRYVPLARKLWKVIVRQFDRLVLNDTFLNLTEAEIRELLCDKHLNIDKSDENYMVRRWIEKNKRNKEDTVRLKNEFLPHTRHQRLPNSIILACGGWSNEGPTNLIEAFDARANCWMKCNLKIFNEPRAYHAIVNTGEHLYTLGGFNGSEFFRSNLKFDLKTKECTEVAPMYDQRCYVGSCLIDAERIIAVGGRSIIGRLSSAEILHIPSNQWYRIAEMNVKRSDGHCLLADGKVFAIGGFDGSNCHSSAEYYDPQGDRWILLGNNMTTSRSGVSAATLEEVIFVCGGFNGSHRLATCEFIDTREGKWHLLQPMNHHRSNFGISVLERRIMVAGGYAGAIGIIGQTEMYDVRLNSWIELPSMTLSRSALYLTQIDNNDIIESFLRSDCDI